MWEKGVGLHIGTKEELGIRLAVKEKGKQYIGMRLYQLFEHFVAKPANSLNSMGQQKACIDGDMFAVVCQRPV